MNIWLGGGMLCFIGKKLTKQNNFIEFKSNTAFIPEMFAYETIC